MLKSIKNVFFINQIFSLIPKAKCLKLIHHSKNLQKKLSISIDDFIKYFNQIEIEMIPKENLEKEETKTIIINIKEEEKTFFHIYLNNSRQELDRNYIKKVDEASKIKIVLDMNIKSLSGLFKDCYSIKELKFNKFNRRNITDMSYMFNNCTNLIKLDISKIKTDNVINMLGMFYNCPLLSNIDVTNLKTNNVTDMSYMFGCCLSLKELDLSNFNTKNVTNISGMFCRCNLLSKLDLSNFNTNNGTNMSCMIQSCASL